MRSKKIFTGIIVSLILLVILWFLGFLQFPDIDTEYSSGFSWEKFANIQNGMSMEEVKNILGEPFSIWHPQYECWQYSRNGKSGISDLNDLIGWRSVGTCFGKDSKVIQVFNNIFH